MAHLLLGVTGSIAAYKAPFLVRRLQKAGHTVRVVLTRGAEAFVSPLVLETLTQGGIYKDLWTASAIGEEAGTWTQHTALAQWADAILIAPATAHTLAKLAQGYCDDLLSALALTARKPLLIAPAMEGHMYRHPFVQANLRRLGRLPWVTIIPPGRGFLASGKSDIGRLAAPARIQAAVARALAPPLLRGKKILLTAGATREPWDAVRFLSNGSTGQMALALAQAAYALHAKEVHVLAGHLEVPFPPNLFRLTRAYTAQAMLEAFQKLYTGYDWLIFAAAVSDYAFAEKLPTKHKKTDTLTLTLKATPDILGWAGAHRRPGQLLIGFALEPPGEEQTALEKLHRKNADWIAYNPISDQTGMGSPTNALTLLSRWNHRHSLPLAPKPTLAYEMLKFIAHATPPLA
ncbi:MAG: bifunctional phosphopantothenoylcysteine decarboxylase/phosphopantothenate--cysteine ligase CoaBC [Bacteroidia bacterium]